MTAPPEALKHRELVFTSEPPGQAERACELLKGLDGFRVERGSRPNSLCISYSLLDYSLEGVERALVREGFRFDDTALSQIEKKLIHYREEVEYHNFNLPQRPGNDREREIFVKAYEHHLHGDHDDTPPELREYK
jgi:hypothetical protein